VEPLSWSFVLFIQPSIYLCTEPPIQGAAKHLSARQTDGEADRCPAWVQPNIFQPDRQTDGKIGREKNIKRQTDRK